MPGPPPPAWRNDSANIAITASFNRYLSHVPLTRMYDGSVTDEQPVQTSWSIVGDMPYALKDGVACWMAPSASFTEGEVLFAGGLWPQGIAHERSIRVLRNRSFSYDVARKTWAPLPLPPFEPGRTQGACLDSSVIIISGGDGGNIGSRVMRLSKSGSRWAWDTALPTLPLNAARYTAAAHAIDNRWLLIGLGTGASSDGVMVPYRLDLLCDQPRWESFPAHPLSDRAITVPIGAIVGGKWLVFGGQHELAPSSAAASAWAEIPTDIATLGAFGPRPSGSTEDVRDAFAYDPAANEWEEMPKLPMSFVQGPKHAPVVGGRYVLLLGTQRRLTVRRGQEPSGYMAAVGRPQIKNLIDYYGDDALFYDAVDRVYGSLGKIPYGLCTAQWVCNGTHALGFGGEPGHGWNGNTESAIQMATLAVRLQTVL